MLFTKRLMILSALSAACAGTVLAQSEYASADAAAFADFELVPEETVTYSNRSEFNWSEFEIELDESQVNWTFHTDLANRILYIDFEAMGGKMRQVQLVDGRNQVRFSDNTLHNLPVNTIYEINLRELENGTYTVLLQTFTGNIRQEIRINE